LQTGGIVNPLIGNSLWFAWCLPEALAFRRATRRVAETQRRVLQEILKRSREYAKLRSIPEFQERVPLSDAPLETVDPVLRRVPTSGTTAATKWIPYTAALQREFERGIAPWIVDLFQHNLGMLGGRSYWALSPVGQTGTEFEDDTEYAGRARRLVASTLAVPATVRHIASIEEWRRVTLRHLVECRDLTFISVWNPTFLMLLVEPLRREDLPGLWPNLRVISCWADAAATQPAAELGRLFPQARIQAKGLIATEGFVSLPLWERDGAALAIRSHFFELLDENSRPRLAHELAEGDQYSVVLTTGGGLYRYRLRDCVRVTGFEGECPLLRFVGKEDNVSDRFGEKVNEAHVRAALEDTNAEFLMVACEDRAYTLYVEAAGKSDAELAALGRKLEAGLRGNVHYRYCRDLGQLAPVRVFRITRCGPIRYLAARHARGERLGNVKAMLLRRDSGWAEVFEGELVTA
jgi:hypothetical protein